MSSSFPFYASVDLETTGLDPQGSQVLEFACILDNHESPMHKLPKFRRVIRWQQIIGEPDALVMNAGLIKEIARQNKLYAKLADHKELTPEEDSEINPEFVDVPDLIAEFWQFLRDHAWDGSSSITFAGKNFSGFDKEFLAMLAYKVGQGHLGDDSMPRRNLDDQLNYDYPGAERVRFWDIFKAAHRVVDVGTHFWVPSIDGMKLPNLQTCLKRAGIDGEVKHEALSDAGAVVLLTRHITIEATRAYGPDHA